MQDRDEGGLAAEQQGSDAHRAAQLVAGEGHRVQAAGGVVDGELADRLDRVGVDRDAELVGDRRQLADRLDGPDLVVGPHHGRQRDAPRVLLDGRPESLGRDPAQPVDGQPLDLGALVLFEPAHAVQHRVVLDLGDEDAAATRIGGQTGPEQTLDREVVGLGATAGEHHLGRPRAESLGDRLAGLFDDATGGAPSGVQRVRVAGEAEPCSHRLDGSREHRRRRGMIKIDGHGYERF